MNKSSRNDKIVLLHDNAASSLATWWKACLLAPPWLYPLVPAIGGALHICECDATGFVLLLIFSLLYFVNDLHKKTIVLDREVIRHGSRKLSVANISKIQIARNYLNFPTILWIQDNLGKNMRLHLRRMSGEDIQTLVNTLQRMSPSCRVDPEVDSLIRYKKAKRLTTVYDTTTTTYVRYHVDRSWEDIPQTFETLLKGWSRMFGPVGVMVLFLPLSVFVMAFLYKMAFSNWGMYSEHVGIYNALMEVARGWVQLQANACGTGFEFAAAALGNPIILLVTMSIVAVSAASYFRAAFGANRITMDKDEISLDSWQHLSSFNLASMPWANLSKVSLSDDKKRQRLEVTSDKDKTIDLDLKGIDEKDRARFLTALKRFATQCEIPTDVEELLDPPTTRSYTQLWLQSITQAPKDAALKPIEAGSTLEGGRYEVIRKLGAGGQGAAYLCHDLRDKTLRPAPTVALKEMLIPPYLNMVVKKTMIERFVAEADMLKNIDSQNVVSLVDYFIEERGAYLVLEHIEGSTLRDLVIENGALSSQEILELLPQMLSILKLLHSSGIVHRDFTPDNLILRPDGMLKLIDFNVAQDESEGTTATIVGKHAYVPPEQFRGKPTTQSDLYALGATMFFLFTGEDPEPITQSFLPEALAMANPATNQLILDCTATEAEERVQTVDELIERFPLKVEAAKVSKKFEASETPTASIDSEIFPLTDTSPEPLASAVTEVPLAVVEELEEGEIIRLDSSLEKQYAG